MNYHLQLNIIHIKVCTFNIYHNYISIQVNLVYKIPIDYLIVNHFEYITYLYDRLFKINISRILVLNFKFY